MRPSASTYCGARTRALLFVLGVAGIVAPAMAQTILFDGRVLPTDRQASTILDQSERCGLDPERAQLWVKEEAYSVEPDDDAGRRALDEQVNQLLAQGGFGTDPNRNQVSRKFIRNLLVNRVLLTLEMQGRSEPRAVECLIDWLTAQGFRRVSTADADAIRSRWMSGS